MHDTAEHATVYDVAIAGGGMIGSTLALLLSRQGFRVAVIEASDMRPQWRSEHVEARVSALTEASRQLFERLGLWALMESCRTTAYSRMAVWDGAGSGEVHFDAQDVMAPALGHIVENSVITDVLHESMDHQPELDCFSSAKVTHVAAETSNGYDTVRTLTLDDGRQLDAQVVVAADGARSPLRRMLGIGTTMWDTHQLAVVAVVTHEDSHQQNAQQIFLPTGPLAFLPLDGPGAEAGHMSSIVWSADTAEAERLLAMDDHAFGAALTEAFEQRVGQVTPLIARTAFPLIQRHAKQYVLPSFALIGDAAHSIHPLAGQGANLGFLDAAVLAEELGRARQQGAPLGDQRVLMRYERRRRMDNATMLKAMEAFCRGFGEQNLWMTWVRNSGLRAVDRFMPLKRFFIRQALGERSDLPEIMRP